MPSMLEGLNEAQRRAVTHGDGPLLIVAGAGTGKTTVLARRYVHCLEERGCGTENILALTFTEKAAEEMESRILRGLPNGAYDFWISTFHGMCQRILESHGLEIGLQNRFRVLSETDAWLLLKRRIEELPLDHYRPLGNPVKFLQGLLRHISRAKDEGVTAERYLDFAANAALDGDSDIVLGERKRLTELADLYFAYQKILRDGGFMDFGDLILETLRLLRERPAVLQKYREQFRYVFVDEFQDTNWAQYELVKLLAGETRNLTVVGDDDQAIYKFRGASLANILQFRDDFPDAAVVSLTENYRSKQGILDAAYVSIQNNNPYRLEVSLAEFGGLKKLHAVAGDGGDVTALWYETLEEEAAGTARLIRERKEAEPDLPWGEMAILVRSNDTAVPFLRALERGGIPYAFAANRGLYRKPFIVDLLSLLTLCVNPHDARHVWRVLAMPALGIPPETAAECLRMSSRLGISLWDALGRAREAGIQDPILSRIGRLRNAVQKAGRETARKPLPETLHGLLTDAELLAALLEKPEQEKREVLHLLRQFAERMARYEDMAGTPTLKDFCDDIRLEIESGDEGALSLDPDQGPDLVNVMTIHASKGLEFSHVFLCGLVDQRFPTRKRQDPIPLPDGLIAERIPEEDTHLSEERRLFYVALTRAKESVALSGASNYGGTREKRPSCFLEELGTESVHIPRHLSPLPETDSDEGREARLRVAQAFPLKRRFSFTQLAAFETCPLQYKFAHVYRIPVFGSEAKSFGQAIHTALHDILALHIRRGEQSQGNLFDQGVTAAVAGGFRVSPEEVEEIYRERWNEHAYWFSSPERKATFNREGIRIIRSFRDVWAASPPDVAALERTFDWKIGQHSIKGSIDRMDRHPDGGVTVLDYKTGEPKAGESLRRDQKKQLWLYQCAAEAMGETVRRLAYVYVRTGEVADVPLLDDGKKEAFTAELEAEMDAVLVSDFPPTPSDISCRYCDFRDICEFRK